MQLATELFTAEEEQAIEGAIREAEMKTAAEIVPVVATVSGRYDRAESIFALLFAILLLVLGWQLFQDVQPVERDWVPGYQLGLSLPFVIIIIVVGYILGVLLATYVPGLRRPFIARAEMEAEVAEAAASAFYQFRVHRTTAGTGLTLYLSLYENLVHVAGDETVTAAIEQTDWDTMRNFILEGIERGELAQGMIRAIGFIGDKLAGHFPIQAEDRNELKNELYLID